MDNACLIVQHGRGIDRFRLGGEPFSIGRHPGNKLCMNDDRMSRRHCVIEKQGVEYVLIDLGSRNGVKVNGQRVKDRVPLKAGDILKVGGIVMQFAMIKPGDSADLKVDLVDPSLDASPLNQSPLDASPDPGSTSFFNSPDTMGPAVNPPTFGSGDIEETTVEAPVVQESMDLNLEQALIELGNMSSTLPQPGYLASDITLHQSRGGEVGGGGGLEDPSGLRLMRMVLMLCIQSRATDVHLEPVEDRYSMRLRVDGVMITMAQLEESVGRRLMNISKVLCELDMTQRRVIQEGHFSSQVRGRMIDYRVSFTPVMKGQKLVIRVLDLANAPARLRELQMPEWMEKTIRKTISRDAGMVLAVGPTGSGKTTSLYAVIREIHADQRNIITIEDPVEYQIPGVTQIPIDAEQGNTFTTLLRGVLRQDPDVILLGEVRDAESAQIAMQAAATGHLVLTSIHAKDVVGALFRLIDLGVEPQLIASAINVVVAQRLVRRLCPHCKRETQPTASQRLALGDEAGALTTAYQPIGCRHCLKTGYHGRVGVYELMEANTELRDALLDNPSTQDLKRAMNSTLFHTLRENAFRLVASGETSIEEVQRVTGS